MAPRIIDMTESEYNQRFGSGVSPEPQPAAVTVQGPTIIDMPESEYRLRYGSLADNALQGIKDTPSALLNAPKALYDTAKGTAGALGSIATGDEMTPEQTMGLRNFGSLAAGTAGALGGAKIGALGGAFLGPVGSAVGGIGGAAVGGGLGLLGIDWLAEQQGIDAPRTTQERLNSLAYNTTAGLTGDALLRTGGVAARSVAAPFKAIATNAGRTQAAANVLDNIYGPGAIGKIQQGLDDLKGNALGQNRPTAELLQTEGAAQLQKQLETEGFGTAIGDKNLAREVARRDLLENMAPAGATIEDVQRAVSNDIDNLRYASRAIDSVLPANIDPTAAGSGIREIAEKLYGAKREGVQDAFAGIPDMDAKRFAPTAELQTSVDRLKSYFGPGSEGAPKDIQRLVETLNPKQKAAPELSATDKMLAEIRGQAEPQNPLLDLNYLQRLRRWAGEEATKRFNKGENRAGSVAQSVVKDIDQGLTSAVEDGTMPKNQADAYKNALKAHADMASTFERGPLGRILRRGEGTTGYNIEPSSVGRQFWNSSPEAMQNFGKALGGDAAAEQLLVRDAITDFRNASRGADGSINHTKVKSWIDDHQALLDSFPDLKRDLSTMYEAEAKAALREKRFGKFVEANPEQAAGVLMSGTDSIGKVQALKQQIGKDPKLMVGLRRGVIDKLTNNLYNSGEVKAKPNAFKRFIDQYEGFVKEVFSPDQVKVLDDIYGDLKSEAQLEGLAQRASAGQAITQQKTSLAAELRRQIMDEFGLAGKVIEKAPQIGGAVGGLVGFGKGYWQAAVGTAAGSWVGGKVAGIAERAQAAALATLAKAAADPVNAQMLLAKATPKNVSTMMKILEPKLSVIRQMLVTGAVIQREDTARAAETLGKAVAAAPQYMTTPQAPQQLQDLASALSQNPSATVPQAGSSPRIAPEAPAMKQKTSTTEPRLPDVSLDVPTAIDDRLVEAVAMQESSNRANAVGPQTKYGRAKGRMQLLDSTGEEMFRKLGLEGKYDPFDAEQNTTIGTAYLKELAARYNGSVPLALASYNWGMGNLDRAIDKIGASGPMPVQAYLENETRTGMANGLSESQAKRAAAASLINTFGVGVLDDYLPDETRNYVSKILNRYRRTSTKVVRA